MITNVIVERNIKAKSIYASLLALIPPGKHFIKTNILSNYNIHTEKRTNS